MNPGISLSLGSTRAGGGGPSEPTITSSDGEPASLTNNGDGTYGVVVGGATVGTITQAQINAGGFITVVAPVTGMSGNNVVLTTTGYVIHVGSTPIETDVEVLADSVVVGTALPFDATAYPDAELVVRFSYSVGGDPFVIGTVARSFEPDQLFAAGEQGFWFDPSDFSTMFQDSAGTVPVTAVGQPVGRINDKSGRGNHATQGSNGARPILRQDAGGFYYLEFDGSDDFLGLTARLWAGGAALLVMGVQGIGTQVDRYVYAEGNTGTPSPSLYVLAKTGPTGSTSRLETNIRFDTGATIGQPNVPNVFDDQKKIISALDTGTNVAIRSNQGVTGASNYTRATNTISIAALGCLRRATNSLFFAGRIYGAIGRAASSTTGARTRTEIWMAARAGVTLP